jgi:hypothetical protein
MQAGLGDDVPDPGLVIDPFTGHVCPVQLQDLVIAPGIYLGGPARADARPFGHFPHHYLCIDLRHAFVSFPSGGPSGPVPYS